MAGGIDWFRWHHGSVTDPKFQLVARKAGASLPEVLAVWAFLLEKASAADFRGCFGEVDAEAVDCLFVLSDGTTDAILAAMVDRKLIADQYVVAWEKRQPKREDETAAERKRRQREREHEIKVAESVTGRSVTPCHAESRSVPAGHDRGEESREEKKETKTARKRAAPAALVSVDNLVEAGVERQHAADWLAVRKAKNLPLTSTAWADTQAEAVKAGISVAEAIRKAAAQGWAGFRASWLQAEAPRNQGPPITVAYTDTRADEFKAKMEQRAAQAVKPPAEVLALARKLGARA